MNELHYAYYDEIAKLKGVWIKNFKLNRGTEAFSFDVDDCIRQVKILKPAVLILTSPNNPTGHTISPAEFLSILRVVPKSTLVLLDEAYIGFQRNYQPGAYLRMLKRFPNLGLMRTFSKDYGLAGIRLAYVLGGRNVMSMLKEEPRDLGLARVQEEVGLAALESETERRQHVKEIIQLRDAFIKSVNATKSFLAYASEANFVLLRARTAVALKRLMVEQARMQTTIVKMYGSRYVRVSIGRRGEQAQLLRMMKRIDGQV
jgi:histidinol-phosphate aminotransferase